ncbi:MAG: DUF2666 family protein [Candidatus Micrarchaeota archaeon]
MPDEAMFEAQIGKWVCIKKAKIEPGAEEMEKARILASIHDSMDRKIWEFIGKDFDLAVLDKIVNEITGAEYDEKKKVWTVKGRKSAEQIGEALAKCNSPSTTKQIPASANKHTVEIAKSYITRKVLDMLGVRLELDPGLVEKYLKDKAALKV